MAKFFRGDKRRREMDRKRRGEEKQRRLQFRREMRAKGLDPDMVDADGNPLPVGEGGADAALAGEGAEEQGEDTASEDGTPEDGTAEQSAAESSTPAAAHAPDRAKP